MYSYSVTLPSGRMFVMAVVALAVAMSGQCAHAQVGTVLSHQKISDTQGGFAGSLDNGDSFGISAASLGDLDGDGTVNTTDLLALFAQWGTVGPADLDGSGVVDTNDLLIIFANWGLCP